MISFQSLIKIDGERCKVILQNESMYADVGLIDVFVRRISDKNILRIIGYNIINHSYVDLKDYGHLSKTAFFIEKGHFLHMDYQKKCVHDDTMSDMILSKDESQESSIEKD